MSKKMNKKEFFEVLERAGIPSDNFECLLNHLACMEWADAERQRLLREKDGKPERETWEQMHRECAKIMHDELDKRGYFDN